MPYFRTGDPEDDFNRLDREQADENLPRCDKCKREINEDHLFEIDAEILCEACMIEKYRRNTNDYLEGV